MAESTPLDRNWLRRLRRNLRSWYQANARELPWRSTSDPYRIWISEIMLQQTTVAAVIPYFHRFFQRFPKVETLAEAEESEVLRYWEGLGYYSRARNIHKTSQQIVDVHAGRFPDQVETLTQLPGIGRYTAGAISSFAFDQPAPIVEANTKRLYSRLLGLQGDLRTSERQQALWEFAEQLLPRKAPGQFNQALMELGGTICSINDPGCETCPIRSCCRAFAEGLQAEIPARAVPPAVTPLTEASIAVRRNGRYLLRRRKQGERWARLWDFPRYSIDHQHLPSSSSRAGKDSNSVRQQDWQRSRKQLAADLLEQTGIEAELGEMRIEVRHSVTRYRIRLFCFVATHRSGTLNRTEELSWVRPSEFVDYPLSVTGRKFAKLLSTKS